jgi:hypothetical protein
MFRPPSFKGAKRLVFVLVLDFQRDDENGKGGSGAWRFFFFFELFLVGLYMNV